MLKSLSTTNVVVSRGEDTELTMRLGDGGVTDTLIRAPNERHCVEEKEKVVDKDVYVQITRIFFS